MAKLAAIFLQNPWSPVYAGNSWPRRSWLRALARSRSGQKVRLLTDDMANAVYNASPAVAPNPNAVMAPDETHIKSILAERQPQIVVACGRHAEAALVGLWDGDMLALPHPAARVLTTALYIHARALLDNPEFFGRWALRQGRGRFYMGPAMKLYPGEDLDDAADRLYSEWRQEMLDAYAEGLRIGRMGLGAGLCPDGCSDDERNEWLKGLAAGAAALITNPNTNQWKRKTA